MVRKIYKTNKGKSIDIEAMRLANEKTIASGNMRVNAKGDVVRGGKIVKTAKERASTRYTKTTQVTRAGLKKPLSEQETKVNTISDAVTPNKPEINDTPAAEVTKTRDDGSQYSETITPEGDIKITELDPPVPLKKKTTKKKKRPTV